MRLRLVAPTKRNDSANHQFEQRIPADLKARLVGVTLQVPRGDSVVPVTVTKKSRSIRFSLGVADGGEAKRRQAEALAYLEGVYQNLRANKPMVQLRKQDVRQDGGEWVLRITPEAGTVKTGMFREVPLHPHLVAMGFPEFVQAAPDGHLFMWSGKGREAWRTAKNRLREEVRKVVPDANVQPNHGWRHTFKTIGREAGIQDYVLDAITGHKPRTEGDKYGGGTLAAKVKAMEAFPRYDVK